jgi:Phage terminase large subunit.
MPLINGKFEPLTLPSEKHARVLCDPGRVVGGVLVPWRFRVLRGGRNGYKDWSAMEVAIERGIRVSTRFLLTREVQNTIADSSYQLLVDTIGRLGYQDYFTVLANRILCKINETSFIFRGLNDIVSEDVKSTEGIDVAIIGEAQNLTEKSMNDFEPTIRKPGSEIWIFFNTQFDTDFVYNFCVTNKPENMISELVTYLDTDCPEKTTSKVIIEQAERDKKDNYELYLNKWMGLPRTIGLFFPELGTHNRETPFILPEMDDNERIIGALDHGIAHQTCYHQAWLSPDGHIHGIFTYMMNGGTARSHAEAIIETIEACRFSRYLYPSEIYYDYQMETKHALNEMVYRSDLDEYLDAFAARPSGGDTVFIPANKRKPDGCHSMRLVFNSANGNPIYKYFDGLNDGLIASLKAVITDKINPEMYSKMDGDDGADTLRYLVMGALTKMSSMGIGKAKTERKIYKKREPLTRRYALA